MRRLKALNIAMEKSEAKTKRVVFAAWLQYAREASKASKWFKSQRASAQEELAMLKISDALGALPYVLRLKVARPYSLRLISYFSDIFLPRCSIAFGVCHGFTDLAGRLLRLEISVLTPCRKWHLTLACGRPSN